MCIYTVSETSVTVEIRSSELQDDIAYMWHKKQQGQSQRGPGPQDTVHSWLRSPSQAK